MGVSKTRANWSGYFVLKDQGISRNANVVIDWLQVRVMLVYQTPLLILLGKKVLTERNRLASESMMNTI
jgi:hypothetical protein